MKKLLSLLTTTTLALALTACAGGTQPASPGEIIRVGSKDFTEQLILGQITLQALAAHDIPVADQTNIAGTENVRSALENADIDLYWEYTGTAWMMIFGYELISGETPAQLFARVYERDAQNGITWLNYAPMNNTYALAIRAETAETYGLRTLSDLAAHKTSTGQRLTLATEHEFLIRPDGLPGMMEAYNFPDFDVRTMLAGIVYSTLADGQADVGTVYTTDGRNYYHGFVLLEDDRNFFPNYSPAPNIRNEALEAFPQIPEILAPIAALLTDSTMLYLNFLVDSGEMEPDEAAAHWLRSEGFINN